MHRAGRRFACPELASIAADSGFAAERVWRGTFGIWEAGQRKQYALESPWLPLARLCVRRPLSQKIRSSSRSCWRNLIRSLRSLAPITESTASGATNETTGSSGGNPSSSVSRTPFRLQTPFRKPVPLASSAYISTIAAT